MWVGGFSGFRCVAKKKTKLELTWIGKENRPKLEPRILIEDPAKSYHAAKRHGEDDIFDNRLIFGNFSISPCTHTRGTRHTVPLSKSGR